MPGLECIVASNLHHGRVVGAASLGLHFRRHWILLTCAVVCIAIMGRLDLFGTASLLPDAAIYGGLHAAALCGALHGTVSLPKKYSFILSAAVMNIVVLYAGIFALGLLGAVALRFSVRVYIVLGVCSMGGALGYGWLIRTFWAPALTPGPIARISIGCLCAALVGLWIQHLSGVSAFWTLATVWWCAFSAGLYFAGYARSRRPVTAS